jgi:hypothetical protein
MKKHFSTHEQLESELRAKHRFHQLLLIIGIFACMVAAGTIDTWGM